MKKNRNSFFAESNFESFNPSMNGIPYQQASNYYYQGPMPNNYNINNMGNDIESRLAKIERQINRLDYRISKLESTKNIISSEEIDTNTNMYML